MRIKKNQAFWTSVVLHGVLLLGLFLATIVQAFRPKEEPHVFVMVDPPGATAAPPAQSQPSEPAPALDLPEIPPMKEIPDPQVPRPKPRPEPQPQQQAAPPKMTYEEFLKQHKVPEPRAQPQQSRKSVQSVEIDTSRIRESLAGMLSSTAEREKVARMSAAEQTALQRYGAQLNARLNRAWIKPANLSGVRLTARVEFEVAANGRISKVRLNPSSGNPAFDQSVLAAFSKVGSGGPTPTGQRHTFTMAFRMLD